MTRFPPPIKHHAGSCASCLLPVPCLRAGLTVCDKERLVPLVHTRRMVKRGEDLYRAGDPFGAIYATRSGFFKSEFILLDGRSQVMGFHMPGDLLGMDGIGTGAYTCSAVALEDAEVCAIPLSRIEEFSREMHGLAHWVYQLMSREMVRELRTMVLLGNMSAEARLATFLVDLSRRFAALRGDSSHFILPMTRRDIGSFLGLKLETVSRMFSQLRHARLVDTQQRYLRILDPAGLEKLPWRHAGALNRTQGNARRGICADPAFLNRGLPLAPKVVDLCPTRKKDREHAIGTSVHPRRRAGAVPQASQEHH